MCEFDDELHVTEWLLLSMQPPTTVAWLIFAAEVPTCGGLPE